MSRSSTRKGVTKVEAGLDLDVANWALSGMWEFPIAITTRHEGTRNGLISLFTSNASTVPEAPRVLITLSKYNLTHDLVSASGVFAVHLLAAEPDSVRDRSLEIIRVLGGNSGRDMDKLAGFETTDGVTGCPILVDALCYVEGRVIGKLETEENTIFLGDVVAAGRLRDGERLRNGPSRSLLGQEWTDYYYGTRYPNLIADARRRRGLPPLGS
jgi:flavin reductase (DIM6/NTAB) family NADH-FMN oxidoreductase RutF